MDHGSSVTQRRLPNRRAEAKAQAQRLVCAHHVSHSLPPGPNRPTLLAVATQLPECSAHTHMLACDIRTYIYTYTGTYTYTVQSYIQLYTYTRNYVLFIKRSSLLVRCSGSKLSIASRNRSQERFLQDAVKQRPQPADLIR